MGRSGPVAATGQHPVQHHPHQIGGDLTGVSAAPAKRVEALGRALRLITKASRSSRLIAIADPTTVQNDGTLPELCDRLHGPPRRPHHWDNRPGRLLSRRLLLEKGYAVHGIKRRASSFNTTRINHLYQIPIQQTPRDSLRASLHYGDLSDGSNLQRIIEQIQPVRSQPRRSEPCGRGSRPQYRQRRRPRHPAHPRSHASAGSHENAHLPSLHLRALRPRAGGTARRHPFHPRSLRRAKLYAYWITVNYREAYGMYACNGLLFNTKAPAR